MGVGCPGLGGRVWLRGVNEAVVGGVGEGKELEVAGVLGAVLRCGGWEAGGCIAHELVLEGPATDGDGVVCEGCVEALCYCCEGCGCVGVGGDEEDPVDVSL